jgi:hypothetical protein
MKGGGHVSRDEEAAVLVVEILERAPGFLHC